MTLCIPRKLPLTRALVLITSSVQAATSPFALGLLDLPEVRAQSRSTARLEFDVASIKPHDPSVPVQGMRVGPDGITYSRVTLFQCIKAAYEVYGFQISGAESFGEIVISDRYDLVAKAGRTASKAEIMQMLRALLSDRFKLKVHRETRELPVYALVVRRGGPKLRASPDDGDSDTTRAVGGGLTFSRTSMSNLAEFLAGLASIHRPVLDRTGIRGVFDFTLEPYDSQLSDSTAAIDKSALYTWPTIFTDIQGLGLKLESTNAPVEILMIDHAEKPSRN